MEVVNLLEFLNKARDIDSLDYASSEHDCVNLLELITEDEQFTQKLDLGIMYVKPKTLDQFVVVDGLSRLLSLSLLLHAVCECYKKTTPKNESAINTIRKKYLLSGTDTKLKLPQSFQGIYHKIIFGERLSGLEKESYIFQLLHRYWLQIKEEGMQATKILKMIKKIFVSMVNTNNVPSRDLYYTINKERRELNQILLISNYLKSMGLVDEWNSITSIFDNKSADINLFFKDFFITKFSFNEYNKSRLYEYFVNYVETMLQFMPEEVLINKIKRTAKLYNNIINVKFGNEVLKKSLIQIKLHNGEDTYAYILNIYEDYVDGNISEATLIEILQTIDEYLKNRIKTPNNVTFNELINYLNTFITCK